MFRINPASGKAIYEQIMEQVKEAAWKGYLKPGDALPSVRKLALSLSVTPNTVAKAYQLLEKEKVIITIRGKGAFLAENASKEVDKGKMQEIKTSLKEILSEDSKPDTRDISGSGGIGYESDRTKGREKIIWKE